MESHTHAKYMVDNGELYVPTLSLFCIGHISVHTLRLGPKMLGFVCPGKTNHII